MKPKKNKPVQNKLVRVEWNDSAYLLSTGWHNKDQVAIATKPENIVSVGFVAHEDDEYLAICQSISSSKQYVQGVMRIMKSTIKKITKL